MRWTKRSPATRPSSRSRSRTAVILSVIDNGRGMPVDPHPKFPKKSALEVIMTMLHAGGKFDSGAYETSGGLHGVGVSVVNALSRTLEVEVARGQTLYRQTFERGKPTRAARTVVGKTPNRRGTKVRFLPDRKIFGARRASIRRACSRWPARRPICSAASRSAGAARRRLDRERRKSRRKRCSTFPAACKDYLRRRHRGRGPRRRPDLHRPGRESWQAWLASNGRSPGSQAPTASFIPIATPSRPPTGARMKPVFAPLCCAASRITPSGSARQSARPR